MEKRVSLTHLVLLAGLLLGAAGAQAEEGPIGAPPAAPPPAAAASSPAPAAPSPASAPAPAPAPAAVVVPAPAVVVTPAPVAAPATQPVPGSGTVDAAPASVAVPADPAPAVTPSATATPIDISPAAGNAGDPMLGPEPTRRQITDLWERIRNGLRIPNLADPTVQQREQYYSTRPDYVARMVERGSRYLFHIVEEVERRRLPSDLVLLPFIESAFNPQAMSSAKASGMWQFMPATGRHFDLKQNLFRDDRRSVVASTNAALDYLERLYGMFGDWHLALAAYNWGEGNVARAIERNRREGLPTDYLSLRMPRETRDYVPKLQAIENIISRPGDFGFALPGVGNHAVFAPVRIERDIDVELAARLAGMRIEDFKALNPQMNKPVILAAGTPEILLPHDNAAQFSANLSKHRGPMASWTAWKAPATMRPADAANRVGMSEDDLREVNRIPRGMLVRAGSTLLVSRAAHKDADVPEHVADHAQIALSPEAPPLRRTTLRARSGDTLASFARRHGTTPAQVAQWNRLSPQAQIKAGQALVVMAPARAGKAVAAGKSTSRSSKAAAAGKTTRAAKASPPRPSTKASQRVAKR